MKTRSPTGWVSFVLLFLTAPGLMAVPRTFTGNGADTNWSTTANWNPAGMPAAADNLIFIAGATPSNNNLTAATFHDFDFNARHTLNGNAFTLTHGITSSAVQNVTINPNITLGLNQTFEITSGSLTSNGTLALNTRVLTVTGAGTLALATITGSGASQIVKNGPGTLQISTIAAIAAGIDLNDGTLDVAGIVTGPVSVDGGRLIGNGQCQGAVTATGGEIVPTGGDLSFANTLTLSAATKVIVSLTGPGAENHVAVTGGAVNLNNAELVIDTTAYQPAWDEDFTLLSKTTAGLVNGTFAGLDQGDEVQINATTVARISYTGGNGNDVVLDIISTTRTWDGGHVINDNWNEAENWSANIRPNFGDVLVFPSGIQDSDRGVDNNFPNDTTFRQLVFNSDDYTIRGNRFRLSHGMTFTGDLTVNFDTSVVLALDQTFDFGPQGDADFAMLHFDLLDEIDTAGHLLRLTGGGRIDGIIRGSGGVTITANSQIGLGDNANTDRSNTYSGETIIESGALLYADWDESLGSTAGPTRIAGTLDFTGTSGGGTGENRTIREPLIFLDGGRLESVGADALAIPSTNKFLGPIHLEGPGTMVLSASTRGGSGVDSEHEIHGTISGNGDLELVGRWTIRGATSNTNTGSLKTIHKLILQKDAAGIVALSAEEIDTNFLLVETDEQISNTAHLKVFELTLGENTGRVETIGSLTLGGSVSGPAGARLGVVSGLQVRDSSSVTTTTPARIEVPMTVTGTPCLLDCGDRENADEDLVISKDVSGPPGAGIRRIGTGTLVFSGSVSIPCDLEAGDTVFNGVSGSTAVIRLNGGGLFGTGTVGNIVSLAGGGNVSPGLPNGGIGTLTCRNISWNATTSLDLRVNSVSEFDGLSAVGNVDLGGAALNLNLAGTLPIGTALIILGNDGTDAINGTFAGLPEGAFKPASTDGWIISYKGGDGNDVVLTRATTPPTEVLPALTSVVFGPPEPNGDQSITVNGKGVPGTSHRLESSIDLIEWTQEGDAQNAAAGTGLLSLTATARHSIHPRQFWRIRRV